MPNLNELVKEYDQKVGEQAEFLKSHKNEDGTFNFTEAEGLEFQQREKELAEKHDAITAQKSYAAAEANADRALKSSREIVNNIGFDGGDPNEFYGNQKSIGQLFVESEEFKANSGQTPSSGTWKAELKNVSVAQTESLKAALTTTTGVVPYPAARPGIVPFATRRPVMRELMPVDDPQGQLVQFIRQNVQTFGAAIVAEGAAKPETSLGTERVTLTMEAIAHYIKVTDQALRFIPGIQNLIDQKGVLGIQLAEESQMLNYNGAAGWKGFLQQSGVQASALGSQDQFTAFHQGMNLVNFTGFANVTGGVIHNNDWHKLVTTKDDNGRFIYGDPFAVTQAPRLWGVPLVATPVITEGTVLIGDFVMDSRWWVAGGIIVKVGYVNDDLTKNQQTIVVEEYAALEIDRPASFVKLTGWEAIVA